MLKIKDNVDLKELEKFGFKPFYQLANEDTGESYLAYLYSTKRYWAKYGSFRLIPKPRYKSFIIHSSRHIANHLTNCSLNIEDKDFIDLDMLYDLIKADLVEKVEE